jgi:hypothetical protein
MKTILTNEKVVGFLTAGILILGGYFINDVRNAIELTRKHETRFAGVDGMIQQVIDVRMKLDTIQSHQSETNGKIDAIVSLLNRGKKLKSEGEEK